MTFLNAVINHVEDDFVKEQLQDRVDIVRHKIKFMDKVPVVVLNSHNQLNTTLNQLLDVAGAEVVTDPLKAKVVVYLESGSNMLSLMGTVPSLIEKEWPAVEYNRLYLMDELTGDFKDPEYLVSLLEDAAELLNPGYFIFGNEGKTWMSFGV